MPDEPLTPIDAAELERLMKDGLARQKKDKADRRCKRGKYAPPVGTCRSCGGAVTGKIVFPSDGRIGGPPSAGYVGSWSCDSCFLVYAQCPPPIRDVTAEESAPNEDPNA